MPKLLLNTSDIECPEIFGTIISQYFHDNSYTHVSWKDSPKFVRDYYWYLDTEEIKKIHVFADTHGQFLADWKGDRICSDLERLAVAPELHKNDTWMFFSFGDKSIRFNLDIENNLMKGTDNE